MRQTIPLIVILGPTAVGKTKLGIELAQKFNGEIISADSMQIYRHMDIGTAKPNIEERKGIPHHMIDIVEPDEKFSVADFQKYVERLIPEIWSRGKLPLMVGGTGLYIKAVVDRYNFVEIKTDWELRFRLHTEAEKYGNAYLHDRLKTIDPLAAVKIHPNDLRRTIRALEVYYQTGKPISYYQGHRQNHETKYHLLMIGLWMERGILYARINQRVDEMIAQGLVEEVEKLLNMGYGPELTSMQGLGYKEMIDYLQDRISLGTAIDVLKQNTRRFAKRQMTWFRPDQRIQWFDPLETTSVEQIVEKININLAGYNGII